MKYSKNEAINERARRVIPGGINSNVRIMSEPCPICYTHGKDGRIWDVDGNEYVDFVLGHGPMLLGHTPKPVIEAIRRQAERGLVYAGQSEQEIRAAELVVEHVPCAEMVRFNSTGSEAVHAAMRVARAATGRKKILRFEGHYHGWHDNEAWCPPRRGEDLGPPDNPILRPSSLGQYEEDAANLFVRPWNDASLVEKLFGERGGEIAAVICDPFAFALGLIPATKEFLETLRRLCDAHGSVLIFDEVITGFRIAYGGAQGFYGVTPDLATFAKALGGGAAVSAVAGKASIMRLFGELKTVHAGTCNGNPLAMAATVAALEMLMANRGAELAKAQAMGRRLWGGLETIAKENRISIQFRGVGSVFSTTFVPENTAPITDMRSSFQADPIMLEQFWRDMHRRGVQFTMFGIWFLSTAHTDTDIDQALDAASKSLGELAKSR
jgi:glutamate-1-semialdehyde 2,1-aminomutase